jgi:hypothetical protein
MTEFLDEAGRAWVATVRSESGTDYKGRYYLHLHEEGGSDDGVSLLDVRWNSPGTAERALATMSEVELRRRLRSGVGRASSPPMAGT